MGWFGALKLVPWSEVIEAAPTLVRGARRLFANSQQLPAGDAEEAPAAADGSASPGTEALQARVQHLAAQLEALAVQQQAAAGVVEALTEHNARLVEAVQALRQRLRWLAGVSALLALAVAALALRG